MAKSKAQKHRAHLVRNGLRDPQSNRGIRPDFDTFERKTPTRKTKQQRQERKHKNRLLSYYY